MRPAEEGRAFFCAGLPAFPPHDFLTSGSEFFGIKYPPPPSPGFGLAEALNGKPFDHVVNAKGGDIPLGRPDLLHKADIDALMRSQPYSDAKHPLYKPATETVRDWFKRAYPGTAQYDETGTI